MRTIGLRVYADGHVYQPAAQPAAALTGLMTRYAELPQLAVDGQGTIWLVFRHWTIQRPTEMYHVYAMKLTDQGWSTPLRLADSSGQNTQWTSIARLPDGKLAVAYASDGRSPENLPKDQVHALIYSRAHGHVGSRRRLAGTQARDRHPHGRRHLPEAGPPPNDRGRQNLHADGGRLPPAHRYPRPQRRGCLGHGYLPLRLRCRTIGLHGPGRPQRGQRRPLARWPARLPVVVDAKGGRSVHLPPHVHRRV